MTTTYIICGYLGLLLGLGFISNRFFKGTAADYFVASRGIGPFLLLMSLFGTTMTAFALLGSTGAAYAGGIGVYGKLASASGIVHALCFFFIGVKLWSLGAKNGYMTQIQFFRDRFQSDKIGLLLFPCLVGLVIPYLLLGILGAGNT
ncbi:MAG: sodium:solute symporter family transporter, partial [Verrucomicrobiia bacterium]